MNRLARYAGFFSAAPGALVAPFSGGGIARADVTVRRGAASAATLRGLSHFETRARERVVECPNSDTIQKWACGLPVHSAVVERVSGTRLRGRQRLIAVQSLRVRIRTLSALSSRSGYSLLATA
jgi:hypothetical protein